MLRFKYLTFAVGQLKAKNIVHVLGNCGVVYSFKKGAFCTCQRTGKDSERQHKVSLLRTDSVVIKSKEMITEFLIKVVELIFYLFIHLFWLLWVFVAVSGFL